MAISHTGGHGGIDYGNIRGWEQVIANLNKEVLAITNGARGGLTRAAKFIERDVETTPPLTPLDKGPLRASFEVHNVHEGGISDRKYGVRFGYSANYALWVHEMVDAVNWSRPNSGAKWLESSINRNHDTILQIIADGVRIKPGK